MSQTNIITNLEQGIRLSRLLTDAEKAHWLQIIPSMTETQRTKLATILTNAAALPWNSDMETYVTTAATTPAIAA